MYAPRLYDLEINRDTVQEFKGYNHKLRIADNEFFDMKNMTGNHYPVLSPRDKRGVYREKSTEDISGIEEKAKLVTIIDNKVYYDGVYRFDLPERDEPVETRQIISMGAYAIIFPDMWYLNTADLTDFGHCFGEKSSYDGSATVSMLGEDGLPLTCRHSIWGEEFFPQTKFYINPLPPYDKPYKVFGLPKPDETYYHGSYAINYQVKYEMSGYGTVDGLIGSTPLYEFRFDTDGVYVARNKELILDNPYSPESETVAKLMAQLKGGGEAVVGKYYITAEIRKVSGGILSTSYKPISLYFENKFYAMLDENENLTTRQIQEGDRRIKYGVPESKSQICIKATENSWLTYNSNNCWRDERTVVEAFLEGGTSGETFTKGVEEAYEKDQDRFFKIGDFAESGSFFDNFIEAESLLGKYGYSRPNQITNAITPLLTVQNVKTIRFLGYLDFWGNQKNTWGIKISLEPAKLKFDHLIEANNRLWGCRYGENYNGDFVNEIYASAKGSFSSFFKFDKTSDASCVLSLGSDGPFTGAVNFRGIPMFFKENVCHAIYGSYPTSYSLTTTKGDWVAKNSSGSISASESLLFYHGNDGIYVYNGAEGRNISAPLGDEKYKNVVGKCIDTKYYASMQDKNGKYSLFVYDTATGMWHKEDDLAVKLFTTFEGDLYMVDRDNRILTANGTSGTLEDDVEWFAESGKIGFASPDSRYIGKIQLKMSLPIGSTIKIYIQYDSDGYWELMGSAEGQNSASFTLPIMPRKCDHFSIKLAGVGACKIVSLTKSYERGGYI